jgi:excisionase family DNA binding protein
MNEETSHEQTSPEPEFLKPAEVASRLRMSVATLWRLMREGAFPHIRITTKNILIKRADMERWLASRSL